MQEDKLQHDIIMWFSQVYPMEQERLFMVQNTTYSKLHGTKMKAMGLRKSVSDLIFVGNSCMSGIELKAPMSKHDKKHIENQLQFGRMIMSLNNYFLMTSDIITAKLFLTLLMENKYSEASILQGKEMIKIQYKIENSGSVIVF